MKVLLCVQYVNTELQRCQQAEEGGPFEMEVVVQTTATYGERFRALIKHRSEASQPPAQAFAAALTSAYPTCEGKSGCVFQGEAVHAGDRLSFASCQRFN